MWRDRRFAGIERLYVCPPKDAFVRVPDQVLKTAVFLGIETAAGIEYGGTGYIISAEYGPGYTFTCKESDGVTIDTCYPFMFIATAAHVAEKLEGFDFYIRANKRDGSLAEIKKELPTQWWYHPTEREFVDAALTLLPVSEVLALDIVPVPVPMFVGEETIKSRDLGIGDEVFIAGLFKNAKGALKNIPILRIGNVAMMPQEKISSPTVERPNQKLYASLVESRSIGGLSGSPVFVRETVRVQAGFRAKPGFCLNTANDPTPEASGLEKIELAGVGRFHFFGSMIGHWQVPLAFGSVQPEAVNMGIAPMVPAQKILEIFAQPSLLDSMNRISEEMEKERQKRDGMAILDSEFAQSGDKRVPFTKQDFENALKKVTRKSSDKK